jgi:hypothetical protein
MDGINRFGLNKVVKEPASPETEASETVVPQSSPQTEGNPASELVTSDGLERFARGSGDPFNSPAIEPHQFAEQAASPDLLGQPAGLTDLVSTRVDTTNQKFNTLTYLLDEMAKTPPDITGLFNALVSLTPQDRKAILEQLASQGNPPNTTLDKLIKVMYGNGESVIPQDMGLLLADLARDVHNDPSEANLFSQIYSDISSAGTFGSESQTVLYFLRNLSGDSNPGMLDTLKSLPYGPLETMEAKLRGSSQLSPEDMSLYHDLDYAYFFTKGYGPDYSAQSADQMTNNLLDAIPTSDPNYGAYLGQFPDWGADKLVGLSKYPAQLNQVIQSLVNGMPPQTLANLLNGLTNAIAGNPNAPSINGSATDIAEAFRQILTTLQDMQQAGNGGMADDIVRSLVDSLNPDAGQTLGKLPPNLLIKMISIIQNGDDRVLSSDAQNALGQALYIAEH